MTTRQQKNVNSTLILLKRKAVPILKKAGVKRSYLFGSYSRGQNRKKSDIDLLIRYNAKQRVTLFSYARLKLDLEEILKKKVDLVMEDGLKNALKPYIETEKIVFL